MLFFLNYAGIMLWMLIPVGQANTSHVPSSQFFSPTSFAWNLFCLLCLMPHLEFPATRTAWVFFALTVGAIVGQIFGSLLVVKLFKRSWKQAILVPREPMEAPSVFLHWSPDSAPFQVFISGCLVLTPRIVTCHVVLCHSVPGPGVHDSFWHQKLSCNFPGGVLTSYINGSRPRSDWLGNDRVCRGGGVRVFKNEVEN